MKKVKRRTAGEVAVEQTRDLHPAAAILAEGGVAASGVGRDATCYLVAYDGDDPVGAASVESAIDNAIVRLLFVAESKRGRGIGAALLSAIRSAAHTRGARNLYAVALHDRDSDFLRRGGFVPVAPDAHRPTLVTKSDETPELGSAGAALWVLDLSQDGIVIR